MSSQPKTLDSLPRIDEYLSEIYSEDWSGDLDPTLDRLFGVPEVGLMRMEDGSVVGCRNKDIRALAAEPAVGNMPADLVSAPVNALEGGGGRGFEYFMANHIFTANPPLHGPLRKVFARQFTKGKSHAYEQIAADSVDLTLKGLAERSHADCQLDLAAPLAAHFWTRTIGLTAEEGASAARLVTGLAPSLSLSLAADEARLINEASSAYMAEVSAAILRRLASGESQLLNEMAAELDEIDLPGRPENVGLLLSAVLFDGFDTLSRSLANVVYALTSSDGEPLEAVRKDPSLVSAAYFESIRLHPPLYMTFRYTLEDLYYESICIPRETPVALAWLFGNRDPRVFSDPGVFKFDRPTVAQTTFGGGFHLCPGRSVARVLGEAMIRGMATGPYAVAVAGEASWEPMSISHTLRSMPISVSRC